MAERTFLERLSDFFGPAAPAPAPLPTPAPAAAAPPVPPAPAESLATDDPRIPEAAKERVLIIRGLIGELEDKAAGQGVVNTELIELRQIQSVHVPRLLKSYAEIPAQHRAEIFRTTGHSASFMLNERLDRVIERLRQISRQLAQGDLDAFNENMRFIDIKYGGPDSPFD